jgi:ligand-binding sensor domain-containing protein
MIRVWGLFILVLLGIISPELPAQYTQPPYRHYTLRDGLPQMQINEIFQDSRGYIWFGTKGGLGCYNGDKFLSFYEKDGLLRDFIYKIGEDKQGNIWINTEGGLTMFDGSTFHTFPADNMNHMPFAPDGEGRIWFTSIREGELICGYLSEGKYHYFPPIIRDFYDIEHLQVFWSEDDNKVYMNAGTQLFEINKEGTNLLYTFPEKVIMSKTPRGVIHFITDTDKDEVMLYTLVQGEITLTGQYKDAKAIGINTLEQPYYLEYVNQTPDLIVTGEALISQNLYGIQKNRSIVDRDGQTWIGSEEGLYLILDNGFETYRSEYFPQVWSVVEDHKGNIWTASFHFGLKKFDGQNIESFPHLKEQGLGDYYYFGSCVDEQGRLYFPNSKGLLEYSSTFRKITDAPMLSSFFDPQTGFIWGGSNAEVHVFDRNRELIRKIGHGDGLDMKRWITCIDVDRQGWHWIGSFAGAVRYNYGTGEIFSYNRKNGKLPDDGIMSIHTDVYGTTWFAGTNGLLWYDAVNDSVVMVEHEDLTETVSFVSSVDTTWLLLSQPIGLYLMDLPEFRKSGRVRLFLFNEKNGYMGIGPGQDGAFRDSRGHFWITSSTELVKFDPSRLRIFTHSVGVRFTACNTQKLSYHLPSITLEPNQRSATVSFEAICFNRPTPVQFSWKLEGGKSEWSPWQEESYARDSQTAFRKINHTAKGKGEGIIARFL